MLEKDNLIEWQLQHIGFGSMMSADFYVLCGKFLLLFGDLEEPLYLSCFM